MITIAICTWNRATQLQYVLADLTGELANGGQSIEVLVIDNNCTDATATIVQSFAGKLPVRRVHEPRQGIAAARNRAILEASGELIILLDDDVRVRPGWLRAYTQAFADPQLMAAGGRVTAVWPERVPRWIRGHADPPFNTVVPHYDLGDAPMEVTDYNRIPPGANIALRGTVFKEIGGFREDLGNVGDKPSGGEDTDFLERVLRRYGTIRYLPDARVDHPVDERRLSLWWNFKYLHGGAINQARFEAPGVGVRVVLGIPLWAVKAISVSTVRAATRLMRGEFRESAIAAGRVAGLTGLIRGSFASRPR